ncbi:gamma-mobile-trio protein GmtX [Methylobacterium radiodurans]|uniref:Uncharacterized protein n=1 Tax=Methylobacterium radiodurans TaxID=2202828 RepID=A0A2U8VPF9_9HYPH|nr:gamma-mobile-trio protein GmtX [Methylobacterium radiodurans]AWN35493.1 hypothetical protein DK427_06920 [Methylobacterium radiodurans]
MDNEFQLPQPSADLMLTEQVPDAFEPEGALAGHPRTLERFREILSRTSSPTKVRQLRNLAWVLIGQARARSADYRVATVGNRTAACGGPTTQTIRNANGADYRALIELFAGEVEKPKAALEPASDREDALLAAIDNPSARNQVRLLLHDCASLRNQVNLLKNQIAREAPPIPTALSMPAQALTPNEAGAIKLSRSRREALEHFISDSNMTTKKWRANEHGALVDALDIEIARPGFVDALRQVLTQLASGV